MLFAEHDKIRSANSILIVGGGPTGVELAGEIAVDFPEKKVTLVHRGSRLLEFVSPKASKKTSDWLVSKKVEVISGQSVDLDSMSDGVYRTSGGNTIQADCHFVCIGKPIGSSWLKQTFLKDSLDSHGEIDGRRAPEGQGLQECFRCRGDIADIEVSKIRCLPYMLTRFSRALFVNPSLCASSVVIIQGIDPESLGPNE